ncbi:MAG TPA: hypothetical protein VFF74_08320 [Methylophilaceae bacterium]|nr:hypothetical protein [Methylophilaceae bacterium]
MAIDITNIIDMNIIDMSITTTIIAKIGSIAMIETIVMKVAMARMTAMNTSVIKASVINMTNTRNGIVTNYNLFPNGVKETHV